MIFNIFTPLRRYGPIVLALFFCIHSHYSVAQTFISGKVTSGQKPLAGVTVSIKSQPKVASSTDTNGEFKIKAAPSDVLVFKLIGHTSTTVPVNGKSHIDVIMTETRDELSEVIVTGYTTINRKKMTGSMASITAKDIENLPAASIDILLQGKLSGVNVQNFTGQPGVKTALVIRGNTKISNSSGGFDPDDLYSNPLYVIDGIPVSDDEVRAFNATGTNYLASLNPNDIESVDVLKDASAAALYGSRAANGVILIKTKRGSSGKPKFSINTYQGYVSKPEKVATLIGAAERRKKLDLIYQYSNDNQLRNGAPQMLTDSLNPSFNNNNDYQDLFYQSGKIYNADIAISGGNESFNYRVSGGYYDEKGVVLNTGFKRYSFTSNLLFRINKDLELLTDLRASTSRRLDGKGSTSYRDIFTVNPVNMPTSLLRLNEKDISSILNPYEYQRNDNIDMSLNGVGELRYTFLRDFRISTRNIISYSTGKNDFASPSVLNNDGLAVARSSYSQYKKYVLTNNVMWNRTFEDSHAFSVNLIQEFETRRNETIFLFGRGIPSDNIQVIKGVQGINLEGSTNLSTYSKLSFLGAFHYDYKSRYLFDAVWRADASSRFGKNKKWGYFPSFAAGWLLSEEEFVRDLGWVNELKVRASWGLTGDESSISDYDRYNAYQAGNGVPSYGGIISVIPNYNGITNDDITWQQSDAWNLGLDAYLLNNRINLNVDVYRRETTGQMLRILIPGYTGYNSTFTNAAGVRNTGLEINLLGKIFRQSSAFQWNPSINISLNRNMVTQLPNGNRDLYNGGAVYVVGMPLNMYYGYLVNGAISSQQDIIINPYTGAKGSTKWGTLKPGYPNWVDVNGDYKISDNIGENDMTFYGDANPKVTGGFNNFFSYKDFTLQVLTTFTLGRDIFNSTFARRMSNGFFYGSPEDLARASVVDLDAYDFWRKEGDIAKYPAANPYMGLYVWRTGQSMFMEPGWYIRIRNIGLAYNFRPAHHEWMQRLKINSFRVFGNMDNVALFQKFSGIDAERVDGQGNDYGDGYPIPKKYTIGLQFNF
ncbi:MULTISPECIES: SusC/RagA family TonB-linked outer membrane protein [unclassified Sphingobacterium]|uniref:SusC/RagA family TonB-linked outer membrane protein n=1 Tax=unclassified Sphingobacterium TaxID=2609468 RepID=UPI0025CDEC69|nr:MULTISPECIES: SusC/RagA family TonB-linked outer membrane protein [unclassified Sphingobacterium]